VAQLGELGRLAASRGLWARPAPRPELHDGHRNQRCGACGPADV